MKNEVTEYLNHLLPPELEIAKELVNNLLNVKPNDRKTNLEYLERYKNARCPVDETHQIKKNGHKNKTQRYWCKICKKSFSITNETVASSSILNYQQLKTLLKCMYDYKSLRKTSLEVGISKTSIFEMQIRIFEALDQIYNTQKLKEVIQVDEQYIRISFKGFKKENMPRPARYDGHTNLTSGISKDQACVIVAIDSYDTIIIKVVGNGNASEEMISNALKDKIDKQATIVTDSKNSYEPFAKKEGLKLIQIPHGQHKVGKYTLSDVNEIMTEISNYLKTKRGVSTRHLQHHMNFIRYRKILTYTIEYLEINENMYIETLKLNAKLKSNDVYNTKLPIDLKDYEKWYSEHNF